MSAYRGGLCEFQAEVGDIANIAEVSFVSSLSSIGQPLWDLCGCQILIEATVSLLVILILKKYANYYSKNIYTK